MSPTGYNGSRTDVNEREDNYTLDVLAGSRT